MIRVLRTVLLLFGALAMYCCDDELTQQELQVIPKKKVAKYKSNISYVDGKYILDTSAILNNNNLTQLLGELEKSVLSEKKKVSEIPHFIKTFLDSATSGFSIANPGEDWQVGCVTMTEYKEKKVINEKTGDTTIVVTFSKPLPGRQLIYLGIGDIITLLTYATGGIGRSEHVLIIKHNDSKIVDFWCGQGVYDLTDKAKILKRLKENREPYHDLNSGYINL